MTQTVKLPDGTTLQFPDGMSQQDMAAAITKNFPQFSKPAAAPSQPNPDGTYGKVPDGMFLNPETGQMTSRELMANNMHPGAFQSASQGAAQGYTFGGFDEAYGGAQAAMGGSYEANANKARAALDAARRDHPFLTTGAELAGAVASPVNKLASILKLPKAASTAVAVAEGAAPAVQGSKAAYLLGRAANVGKAVAESAAQGAALGGLYGYGTGEGDNRLASAANGAEWGGLTGAAVPAIGALAQKATNGVAARRAVADAAKGAPTTDELRAAGQAAYRAVDDAGVQVSAPAFDATRQKIIDTLRASTAYTPRPGGKTITPNTAAVVSDMGDMAAEMAGQPGAALPFKEIDSLRRQAGAAAGNVANKSDQQAGMTLINGLDEFVNNLKPEDVVTGDPAALQSAITTARDTWAKMSRSQTIDDAIAAGENYLGGATSGIRNQFKTILKNPKLSRGFSDAEREAMQRVINGGPVQQAIQLAGSGLGRIAAVGAGYAAGGGIPGALLATAAGAGARKASDALTRHNAELIRAAIANGGIPEATPPDVRALISRLLLPVLAGSAPRQSAQ